MPVFHSAYATVSQSHGLFSILHAIVFFPLILCLVQVGNFNASDSISDLVLNIIMISLNYDFL